MIATTMTALVQPAYGTSDVLRVESVARPTVGDDDVLVRVHAASVCRGDIHVLTGKPYLIRAVGFGVRRPNRPIAGQDMAGQVEAVGRNVTAFRPGDDVFGRAIGSFAEYVAAPANMIARKPRSLSYEQAAAVPDSGMTALQGLRDTGNLQPGQRVLINGAAGGIGSFAIQIAKILGAEVTAVCSTRHVDKLRALGADHVVDYTRDDFAALGPRHDVMFDLVGNRALADCRRAITPRGIYVASAGGAGGNWLGPVVWLLRVNLAGLFRRQRSTSLLMKPRAADLDLLAAWLEAGRLVPLIERRFPLSAAADAVRHVEDGHAQGKTVVTM